MAHFMIWISKMVNTIAEMVTSRVASPSSSRAVTLLEYVLLAAMVVVAVGLLAVIFNEEVSNLVDRITTAMGGTG